MQSKNRIIFEKWCEEKKIKWILLDIDGTICNTPSIFINQMDRCCDYLYQETGRSADQWLKELRQYSDELFATHFVNPKRWEAAVKKMASIHKLPRRLTNNCIEILMCIYKTPIPYLPGAEDCLIFLKTLKIPLALVTHAGRDWTDRKFKWLGLNRFVDKKNVWAVDINTNKTDQSWQQAMDYLIVKPENCLVIGDSPKSDIEACLKIGVPTDQVILVNEMKWSIHQTDLPKEVKRIDNLGQLMLMR